MSITQTTPQEQINAYLKQQIDRRINAIINAFNYVGFTCINEARANGSYHDVTGFLRGSIGFVIVRDGVIVSESGFESNGGGSIGKAEIQKLAAKFPHGIALIVVAGMTYASAVEARNFNVLSSAELMAEQMVPQLMNTLGFTT